MIPDLINGLFECFGFIAISFSIARVYKSKSATGISIVTSLFFTSWGLWNLFYYPHLGQRISFIGAGLTCIANTIWLLLIINYQAVLPQTRAYPLKERK